MDAKTYLGRSEDIINGAIGSEVDIQGALKDMCLSITMCRYGLSDCLQTFNQGSGNDRKFKSTQRMERETPSEVFMRDGWEKELDPVDGPVELKKEDHDLIRRMRGVAKADGCDSKSTTILEEKTASRIAAVLFPQVQSGNGEEQEYSDQIGRACFAVILSNAVRNSASRVFDHKFLLVNSSADSTTQIDADMIDAERQVLQKLISRLGIDGLNVSSTITHNIDANAYLPSIPSLRLFLRGQHEVLPTRRKIQRRNNMAVAVELFGDDDDDDGDDLPGLDSKVVLSGRKRNKRCDCGSGKKWKKCCGLRCN